MPNPFNQQIIDEFRANDGRVGGMFAGSDLILLTTRGARSGNPHTTPLGVLTDGDRILVIASAAGAPTNPDWFHNVRAHSQVTVETGAETYEATATPLTGAERDEAFTRAAADDPGWSDYQAKTTRTIPVIALTRITAG
ncbi:nitroreductase family deazaflavin-dependent oxidoreductase [Actinoplanes sp. TRM 88003]|uniref:Nitroreductase family deazaflavin-dependent oxidoreductase n=1 Tax=Paractinoplanes aksuensis TaxID=2939490 RepID=A0ABT1DKS4_9ACTN|nr:nitroreductase family deazaflavin-dependent oxidoreductase [Actinoplanes aksuensis]MCO8271448.1 nitroreductase family deazaflavin-dependent oxidoreductase [Actinoplanes aksuensis]